MPLTEKEFEIINVVADGFRFRQRDISNHVGLSLGMTNLLLKRMMTKGFLRAKQLDRKKVEYLLTPRGLSEKAKKTYFYTLKTIESFGLIRSKIIAILDHAVKPSTATFLILGRGDLADFIGLILRDYKEGRYGVFNADALPPSLQAGTLVINTLPNSLVPKSRNIEAINLMAAFR